METKTIPDIIADIRSRNQGCPLDGESSHSLVEDMLKLADDIEAAYKREVGVAKTETTTADATVESVTTCNGLQDSCKQSLQGNAAKLREALKEIARITNNAKSDFDIFAGFERILKISNSALATPPEPVGNAAKLREALKEIEGYAWVYGLWEIEPIAKAALAAPPRNCDKCKNADEAFVLAVDAGVVECDFDAQDMAEFLLAEAEGETK